MKHRALVLASAPPACLICEGRRCVTLFSLADRVATQVRCLHCTSIPGIPIYVYPLRADEPRGAA